jgi:hypothetical protein
VLLRDHHVAYITWEEYASNQTMIAENAHMQKRTSRKSARGGRALLTGLLRCGRCGRMMRVFYGSRAGHSHRYLCWGDQMRSPGGTCTGIGGVRVDRTVAAQLLEAVAPHAIDAALEAAAKIATANDDVRKAMQNELEEARYEASLASRRYESVDPTKRLVARELEARWESALRRVGEIEGRLRELDERAASQPRVTREALLRLADDLPKVWNAPTADVRTKQRIVRALIREVIVAGDGGAKTATLTIHWTGGRHTDIEVKRVRTGRYPEDRHPNPVDVVRVLGGKWSDREVAVTMNRMRCSRSDGNTWTTFRVRELRERLGVAPHDATAPRTHVSVDDAAKRLGICVGSVHRLIREGTLPATQLMPSAPWQIPLAALDSDAVRIGVQSVVDRRPRNYAILQDEKVLRLPGF